MIMIAMQAASTSQGAVTAAIIAATVAVLLGVANIVVTVKQGKAIRDATKLLADREQWWSRFTWAAGELFSSNEQRALVAVSVLNALADVKWIHQDDRDMIFSVFEQLNADIYGQEVEGSRNG